MTEEKRKSRDFNTTDSGSSCSSLNERLESNEDGYNGSIGRARGRMKNGEYTVPRRASILNANPSAFQNINEQTRSSPKTSVSADSSALSQERLVELIRQYDIDENVDDKILNELLNLAMSCVSKLLILGKDGF